MSKIIHTDSFQTLTSILIADSAFLFLYALLESIVMDIPDAVNFVYPLCLCTTMVY
jgi:hypothetical protein